MSDAVNPAGTPATETPAGAASNPAAAAPTAAAPASPEPQPAIGNSPPPAEPVVAPAGAAYEPTGNSGLDYALNFVGGLGIDGNHAAIKAAEGGDFSLLKAELARMGDKAKGWEQVVKLGEDGLAALRAEAQAKGEKNAAAVHEAVGGKEKWEAISKWAGENAEPAEKEAVNLALAQGGFVAKAVARALADGFSRATGVTVPAQEAAPGARSTASTGSEALGPREYTQAVAKLQPNQRVDGNPAYEALKARAVAYMNQRR